MTIQTLRTRFLFVRHGQTDWNVQQRCQGHFDVPLNKEGLAQAAQLADCISARESSIAAIYSSDLSRAYQTAQAIADKLNLTPVKHESFRELYQAAAQGMTHTERETAFGSAKKELDERYAIPERWNYSEIPLAETRKQLLDRVSTSLSQLVRLYDGKTVIIVTHYGVIQTLISSITHSMQVNLPNCCVVEFEHVLQQNNSLLYNGFHDYELESKKRDIKIVEL